MTRSPMFKATKSIPWRSIVAALGVACIYRVKLVLMVGSVLASDWWRQLLTKPGVQV